MKNWKSLLKEGSKYNFRELLSKLKDSGIPPEDVQTYEIMKQKIEEFKNTLNWRITDVSVTEPLETSPVTNQLNTMLKIFENQANKLERNKGYKWANKESYENREEKGQGKSEDSEAKQHMLWNWEQSSSGTTETSFTAQRRKEF